MDLGEVELGLRRPQRADRGRLHRAPPLEAATRGFRGRDSREDVPPEAAVQQARLQPRHIQGWDSER